MEFPARHVRLHALASPLHCRDFHDCEDIDDRWTAALRLDEIGFDEAWIGEHHSAGFEIIGSPAMFVHQVMAHFEAVNQRRAQSLGHAIGNSGELMGAAMTAAMEMAHKHQDALGAKSR